MGHLCVCCYESFAVATFASYDDSAGTVRMIMQTDILYIASFPSISIPDLSILSKSAHSVCFTACHYLSLFLPVFGPIKLTFHV